MVQPRDSLLLPKGHISRKLEVDAVFALEPRHSNMGSRHPKQCHPAYQMPSLGSTFEQSPLSNAVTLGMQQKSCRRGRLQCKNQMGTGDNRSLTHDPAG